MNRWSLGGFWCARRDPAILHDNTAAVGDLRAEIDRLQRLNEKLGNSFDKQITYRIRQIDALEAEVKRLRAALEEIRDHKFHGREPINWAIEIAAAALLQPKEGKS